MPALPSITGGMRVAFKWIAQSDLAALSRIFLTYSGVAPTAADLITLADVFVTSFNTNLKDKFSETNGLDQVEITDLSSPTGAVGESTTGPITGTEVGLALPAATSVLINYGLDRRYRGGHPRTYVPAFTIEDLDTEQTWLGASLTAFLPAWTDFIESAVGSMWAGGGTPTNVNVSYFEGFTAVQNPITLRWRNVPKVRTTPVVDTVATISANPAPCFQTRRGLIP
jgi:hypothetical protein